MALVSVVGATGRQGLAQIRQLAAAGHKVRALSRSKNPDLGGTNAADEVRQIDLTDESTWIPAFEGSDAVFYTHPLQAREDRATMVGKVAAAAKEAGTERFVWNTSSWIPERPGDPFTYGNNTIAVNEIFRSGMPATVFGSVLFMDNLLTNWARPFIVDEKRYVYPHNADLQANWISLDDVGKCMVAAMDRPDFEGSWLNIGGMTYHRKTGRPWPPGSPHSTNITTITKPGHSKSTRTSCSSGCRKLNSRRWKNGRHGRTGRKTHTGRLRDRNLDQANGWQNRADYRWRIAPRHWRCHW